jgi:hypothetical protein
MAAQKEDIKQDVGEERPEPVTVIPEETKVLLSWEAPARPFKKRNKEYYTTIGAIVILLAVILLFLKEWLLIAVMAALAFLAYVMASIEPGQVKHQILNRGIKVGKDLYPWGSLTRFWFTKKWGVEVLNVELRFGFPGRLMLLLKEVEKKRIEEILGKYLLQDKPEDTWLDKAAKWLQKQVPLEG